jgi:hypothetical protein
MRQTLDNIYMVNNGRNVVNESVDLDDLLTVRQGGVIRVEGENTQVQASIMPLVTEYIGDKSLQVIQYMDLARAQSTGSLMASQGLDADQVGKETATRFKGIEAAATAKIELVARTLAETGFRKLYEGINWIISQFANDDVEIMSTGEKLSINPQSWKRNHRAVAVVGLGAGDNDKTLQSLLTLWQVHQQLQMSGSPLTDTKKQHNILTKMIKAVDLQRPGDYVNNPEKPDELLLAENEILRNAVAQLQTQAQNNPLAEAEAVKAQAELVKAEGKRELDIAQMLEDQRQFNQKLAAQMTELELKYGQDVPGATV